MFPAYTLSHVCNTFGLRIVVQQTAWDLLYNVEVYREDQPRLEMFSAMLRELFDTDVCLFYLHVRALITKYNGDGNLLEEPVLARVLRRLLLDEKLVAYVYEMLVQGDQLRDAPGHRFPVLHKHKLLEHLVDQFRRTPMAIIRRLRYNDDGSGARMMAQLQNTQRLQQRRGVLEARVREEKLKLGAWCPLFVCFLWEG